MKPELKEGEIYIGAITGANSATTHIILLPGDADPANWKTQNGWAESIGGDLPNKLEAAMLFAHCKDEFKPNWHWTGETFIDPDYPSDAAGYAWYQSFYNGHQHYDRKCNELRARAVRRVKELK